MTDYKATPEQWAQIESWMATESAYSACLHELRARVEALEKDATEDSASTHFVFDAIIKRLEALETSSKPTPNDRQIGSSLVERVASAIGWFDQNVNWKPEARAAIREVAVWLRENYISGPANVIEQEAER